MARIAPVKDASFEGGKGLGQENPEFTT